MTITSISQQQKNIERVNIFVDEKYAFSLSIDELLHEKLKKGTVLDEAGLKRLQKISADGKLKARSLEWLLNRPRSEREFRDYLRRKKVEPETIDSLVDSFTQKGYVDERKFGEWYVELQKRRNKSDRAIRSELFKKGLGREMVDQLLQKDENDEIERLKALISKKKSQSRYKNDPLKLAKYLTSQGFSYAEVKQQLTLDNSPN